MRVFESVDVAITSSYLHLGLAIINIHQHLARWSHLITHPVQSIMKMKKPGGNSVVTEPT